MECARVRELIDPYLDGELTKEDAAALEQHLKTCAKCAYESTQVLRMKEVIQRWQGVTPSGLVRKEVLARVHDEIARHGAPRERYMRRTVLSVIGLSLAVFGAFLLIVYVFQTHPATQRTAGDERGGTSDARGTVAVPATTFGRVAGVSGDGVRIIGREGDLTRPAEAREIVPGETVEVGETSLLIVDMAGARLLIGGMAWRGKAPSFGLSGSTRLRFASPEAALDLSRGVVRVQTAGAGVGDIRFRTPAAVVYVPWTNPGGGPVEVSICATDARTAVAAASGEAGLLIVKPDGSTLNFPVKKGRLVESNITGEVQDRSQ